MKDDEELYYTIKPKKQEPPKSYQQPYQQPAPQPTRDSEGLEYTIKKEESPSFISELALELGISREEVKTRLQSLKQQRLERVVKEEGKRGLTIPSKVLLGLGITGVAGGIGYGIVYHGIGCVNIAPIVIGSILLYKYLKLKNRNKNTITISLTSKF